MKKKKYIAAIAAMMLLAGCGSEKQSDELYDPYEGMVQVESGMGTKMWVKLHEDIPVSNFRADDFSKRGKRVAYEGGEYEAISGIDVSEHQGAIDWAAVAEDGVDFAIIRAGYRGYSEGGLFVDDYFHDNMDGAQENGIDIGVYFFSQATTPEEAVEEAEFLIGELLSAYSAELISLPVFYDWEAIGTDDARTDGMSGDQITECAVAFCQTIEEAGYDAGIYAYRNLGYFSYDLPRLTGYSWWIAALGSYPDFYYEHDMWQYSVSGQVNGIDGDVDLNLRLVPAQAEPADSSAGTDAAE